MAIQIPELEEGVYIAEKMKAQAEIALAKGKEVAQGKGVTPEVILATGASPADAIVRVAKEQQADLIVIGSRGLAGETRLFPGQHRLPGGNLLSLLGSGGQNPGLSLTIAVSPKTRRLIGSRLHCSPS